MPHISGRHDRGAAFAQGLILDHLSYRCSVPCHLFPAWMASVAIGAARKPRRTICAWRVLLDTLELQLVRHRSARQVVGTRRETRALESHVPSRIFLNVWH